MKRVVVLLTLALTPLLTGAMARLAFFNGMIGDGVKAHCARNAEEKEDDMRVVNAHTGPYRVVIVCEADVQADDQPGNEASVDSTRPVLDRIE